MQEELLKFLTFGADLIAAAGCVYSIASMRILQRFQRTPRGEVPRAHAISVLRPLHGTDPGLYENLGSSCAYASGVVELICGVQCEDDPAIPVVKRLQSERPDLAVSLVVDPTPHGRNLKVANLMNMLPAARHPLLVMMDSDMRAPADFLVRSLAALRQPDVGLVTALYRGRPADRRLWSRLAAQYVNHTFLPQALLGERTRPGQGCFGAGIAITRETLEAIGGFAVVADTLADDYALGAGVRAVGKRVVVGPVLLDNWITEPSFQALLRHEVRWLFTIRSVAPWGHVGLILTQPVAFALIAALLGAPGLIPLAGLAVALLVRFGMVRAVDRALELDPVPLWQVPVRDVLSFAVYVASFFTKTVAWRDHQFRVSRQGRLTSDGDRTR